MVGRLDVDAMLDELTPRQFDEWVAYRTIEPDPIERICEILKRGFSVMASMGGGKMEPDEFDLKTCDDGNEAMSPAQSAAMARQAIGRSQG